MPCPFTARLSAKYLKNYAPSLLNLYADQCPVISRASASYHHQGLAAATGGSGDPDQQQLQHNPGSCPFLLKTVQDQKPLVKRVAEEERDVIEVNGGKIKGECKSSSDAAINGSLLLNFNFLQLQMYHVRICA